MRSRIRFKKWRTASGQAELRIRELFIWIYTQVNGLWSILFKIFGKCMYIERLSEKPKNSDFSNFAFNDINNLQTLK